MISRPIILLTSSARGSSSARYSPTSLSVAQHRDAIGDLVDLVEEVGDEQDRDAVVAQAADDGEEPLDLVAVEARGRFVEDQHPRIDHHGAADRDELLDGDRVARQQRVRVELQAEVLEVSRRLGVDRSSGSGEPFAARGRA